MEGSQNDGTAYDIGGFKSLEGIIATAKVAEPSSPEGFLAVGRLETWVALHPNDQHAIAELGRYSQVLMPSRTEVEQPA